MNIQNIHKILFPVVAFIIILVAVLSITGSVSANSATTEMKNGLDSIGARSANPNKDAGDAIKKSVNTLLFIVGALSVLVLIYGGFLYVTSTGDTNKVGTAKNTILYAVIGVIVSISAYAILDFVARVIK